MSMYIFIKLLHKLVYAFFVLFVLLFSFALLLFLLKNQNIKFCYKKSKAIKKLQQNKTKNKNKQHETNVNLYRNVC